MNTVIKRIRRLVDTRQDKVRELLLTEIHNHFEGLSNKCGMMQVIYFGDDPDDFDGVLYCIRVQAVRLKYYMCCKLDEFFRRFVSLIPTMDANSLSTLNSILHVVEGYASNFIDLQEHVSNTFGIKLVPASSVTVGMKVLRNVGDANGLLSSREVASAEPGVDGVSIILRFVGWDIGSLVNKSTHVCVLVENQ